jgi:uncharacterized membrane protein HdeD (DUF308 family)
MQRSGALRAEVRDAARWWWVFIVSGIFWFMVSLVVLRFTTTSVTTVGILIGVVFAFAAITEFMVAAATSGGWRVVHAIVGVFFVLGAIWGFVNPKDAFWALASMVGFVLVIYGTVELVQAVATRAFNPLWWLGLVAGILLVLLGFWSSQQLLVVKAQLLIFYVGLAALFRGIGHIVFAFQLRHAGHELTDA